MSSPTPQKERVADLLVLLVLAGLVVLYCASAIDASAHLLNLILVLPVSALILICCAIQFVLLIRQLRSPVEDLVEDETEPKDRVADVLPVMVLFSLYVLSLNWLGFDVGTFLFIGAFLWLHGERRWLWLLAYAFVFASLISIFFATMLPYPMPMLILSHVSLIS